LLMLLPHVIYVSVVTFKYSPAVTYVTNETKEVFAVVRCACCEAEIPEEEVIYGDKGTYYEGKPLCDVCYYEDEPCATVYYGDDDYPHEISYTRNETDGEFRVRWVSTDPWRGYYTVESDVYERIHEDAILAYSYDADQLKRFDEEVRRLLDWLGVRYARVFERTSNLFSTGYDLFVHKEDLNGEKGALLTVALNLLKLKYRNPVRFKITALTGKTDPADFTESDKLLAEAFDRLVAGEDPEKVEADILSRFGGVKLAQV